MILRVGLKSIMKKVKMSLANAQGKLSRQEMKTIMAGSGSDGDCPPCDPRKWIRYSANVCVVSGYC